MLLGSWRRAQRICPLQVLIARIRGLVCILVWCSSLFFMSFPALGGGSGKSLYDKIGALDARQKAAGVKSCWGQVLKSEFCQKPPGKMALQQKQYCLYYY